MNQFLRKLFQKIDIASLVYFRIAFAAILIWEVYRYFSKGWIARYYIDPTFHFKYFGFDWVSPWAGNGMYIHWAVLGLLAFFIMIGLWYRLSTVLLFLALKIDSSSDFGTTFFTNVPYTITTAVFLISTLFFSKQWMGTRLSSSIVSALIVTSQMLIFHGYTGISPLNPIHFSLFPLIIIIISFIAHSLSPSYAPTSSSELGANTNASS